jgi:hypothetical protein
VGLKSLKSLNLTNGYPNKNNNNKNKNNNNNKVKSKPLELRSRVKTKTSSKKIKKKSKKIPLGLASFRLFDGDLTHSVIVPWEIF